MEVFYQLLPSNETYTYLYIWFILFVALLFFLHLCKRYHESTKRVSTILGHLQKYQRNSINVTARNSIKEKMEKETTVKALWHEFDESLVSVQEESKVFNTIDASFFFNAKSLGTDFIDSRLIASVPGLLTALGVLGTFYGLSMGLSGAEFDGTTQEMIAGIKIVLSGAKTAFATSLWGVAFSFFYNIIEKVLERILQKKIKQLQDRIDELFPRMAAEHQLQQIVVHSKESRESLQGLAEQIGNRMQEVMVTAADSMGKTVAATLEKTLGAALSRLNGGNEEALGTLLEGFTTKLEEIAGNRGKELEAAANHNKETFDTFTKEMNLFIRQLDKRMETQETRDLERNESLKQVTEEIASHSEKASTKLREAVESMILKLGAEMGGELVKIKERDIERTEQQSANSERMGKIISAFKVLLSQSKELNSNVEKTSNANLTAAQELKTSAIEIRQTSNEFKKAGETVSDSVVELGNKVTTVAQRIEDISEKNKNSTELLERVQLRFEDQYKRLNDVMIAIDKLSIAAENTFDTLSGKQAEFLKGIQKSVQDLMEKMSEFFEDYTKEVQNQTVSRMNDWNEQTREYSTQMQNVVTVISDVVDEIDGKIKLAG